VLLLPSRHLGPANKEVCPLHVVARGLVSNHILSASSQIQNLFCTASDVKLKVITEFAESAISIDLVGFDFILPCILQRTALA